MLIAHLEDHLKSTYFVFTKQISAYGVLRIYSGTLRIGVAFLFL